MFLILNYILNPDLEAFFQPGDDLVRDNSLAKVVYRSPGNPEGVALRDLVYCQALGGQAGLDAGEEIAG